MTAVNNLKGRIVKDGSIVYSEELDNGLFFCVIGQYAPTYRKENYADSSNLYLEAAIVTWNIYTWSNGVITIEDADTIEKIDEHESWRELQSTKTKQGFNCFEVSYGELHFEQDNQRKKSRHVKWIVEVPKEEITKFVQ